VNEDFHDTVAIVAGGARGIGRACALRLAGLGTRVAVLDRDLAGAAEFGEQLGAATVEDELRERAGDGLALQVDLSRPEATEEAIGAVVERWSRLDFLVIPAGGAITPYARSRASESPDEDLSTLVDANMRTVLNCCRAAVPRMSGGGGGSIVTVSSGSGLVTMPEGYLAAYGMVKAAVAHYTRYLAAEVGPLGIRVNSIAPGIIQTARLIAQSTATNLVSEDRAATIPLRRMGVPDDIADAVEFLISSKSSWITGQVLAVDGGSTMV
jgi:NAD(P)-dependent dehydrogenase (short-subunit alcohol dehydrogenase family)